jgi:hypothetical protein
VRCSFKKSFLSIHKSIHKVGSYCLPIRLCGNRVAFAFAEVGLDRSTQPPERHIQRLAVPYTDVVQEPARPLLLYATSGGRGERRGWSPCHGVRIAAATAGDLPLMSSSPRDSRSLPVSTRADRETKMLPEIRHRAAGHRPPHATTGHVVFLNLSAAHKLLCAHCPRSSSSAAVFRATGVGGATESHLWRAAATAVPSLRPTVNGEASSRAKTSGAG